MDYNPAAVLGSRAVTRARVKKVKADEQRSALADEDLAKIFSAYWFQHGKGELTAKGVYYRFRPHYYWLPLLALYCGGRLNELCQLYLKDIVVHESVPCIDFNLVGENKLNLDDEDSSESGEDAELAADKSLKNISSERLVPIPKALMDLGFLEYVEQLRHLEHGRLFPELVFDREKGYGKAAGSWFNERFMGRDLQIKRDGKKTFHSMRHNFATALGAAGIASNLKADLMGHSRTGTTGDKRYDKGVFDKRKAALETITYNLPKIRAFDVKEGVKALDDALRLKTTRVPKTKKPSAL